MTKISLGCGRKNDSEFIGLDSVDFGHNKIWRSSDPIPFDDDSVDFIQMHNFMEHVDRREWIPLFNECWRVLKKDGILQIITPDAVASMSLAMSDPTHLSLVTAGTFKYFTGEKPRNADYGIKHWGMITLRHYEEKEPAALFVELSPKK